MTSSPRPATTTLVGKLVERAHAALNSELREHLERRLDMLVPQLRGHVGLRDLQGLSNEEVADVLETTIPSLKSKLHRGKAMLRKHLEEYVKQRG